MVQGNKSSKKLSLLEQRGWTILLIKSLRVFPLQKMWVMAHRHKQVVNSSKGLVFARGFLFKRRNYVQESRWIKFAKKFRRFSFWATCTNKPLSFNNFSKTKGSNPLGTPDSFFIYCPLKERQLNRK